MAAPIQRHPWDETDSEANPPVRQGHAWENESDNDICGDGSDTNDPDPHSDPEAAAKEFLDVLIGMYMTSAISGQLLTTLCYWAGVGGLRADVPTFGRKPGTGHGHCTRHLNKLLGFEETKQKGYSLEVPGHRKHDLGRSKFNMEAVPPHESILREAEEDPTIMVRLQEAKAANQLPPSYTQHCIVESSPDEDVLPMSLYMDGLPYSHTDSVVGVWLINMISGMRHMVAVIRKRICCKCGCRSFCTFNALHRFIHWSLSALADKMYPQRRHDQLPWQERDAHRASVAGQPTRLRAALCQIKGDWSEFCSRFGLPNWQSNMRPCFLCNASPDQLFSIRGVSPISLPWCLNDPAAYFTAIARCEITVVINAVQYSRLRALMKYDKRAIGSGGLALTSIQGIEDLNLLPGDRLEPNENLYDIGDFFTLSILPVALRFWRRANETIALRRCALFDARLGITPDRTICADVLHTFHLGILLEFAKLALWRLLDAGVWGPLEGNLEESLRIAVLTLRNSLWSWYEQRHETFPEEHLTRLADLVPSMLGNSSSPKLKTKASETWGVALFVNDMLLRFGHRLDDEAPLLQEAGQSLVDIISIMRANGNVLPPSARQDLQ